MLNFSLMKVLLYGRYGQYPSEIEDLVKSYGLEIVSTTPDVIITYGGDGTLLGAERDFPGIPKLYLKNTTVGYHASKLPNEKLLELLAKNKLIIKTYSKIEAVYKNDSLVALNDIVVRNIHPNTALRFSLTIDHHPAKPDFPDEFIGDGIVVATPFGSSGYFFSISRRIFDSGLGLAFNNIHNFESDHVFLHDQSEIELVVHRGPGILLADNNPEMITLKEEDELIIKKSLQEAKVFSPEI